MRGVNEMIGRLIIPAIILSLAAIGLAVAMLVFGTAIQMGGGPRGVLQSTAQWLFLGGLPGLLLGIALLAQGTHEAHKKRIGG